MRPCLSLLLGLTLGTTGCGESKPVAPITAERPPLDVDAMRSLRPQDPQGAAIFDPALEVLSLRPGDTDGGRAIGALAFHLTTLPVLAHVLAHGSTSQVREALMGLRGVTDGTASMMWDDILKQQGTDLETYRPKALEVLKTPALLAQVKAGIAVLAPQSRGAFAGILTALGG